jgi:hypothetical protein
VLLRAAATTKSCPTDPVSCASHIPIQNWHAEPYRQQRTRANKIHKPNAAAPRPSHCARSNHWHPHACPRRRLHAHSARMTPQRDAHVTLRTPMQHSTFKSRALAGRPAQPRPLYTAITSLQTTAARTPHTTYRTAQFRALHTPLTENHTQSHSPFLRHITHTHDSPVRLPSVDGMLPESWLLCKSNSLQNTRTAIASHHGTRYRRRPQPAARNASQRIA